MKRNILITAMASALTLVATAAMTQPQARAKQATSSQRSGISPRAQLMYPTAPDIPDDVIWRRDLYREIRLDHDANSGLYYPVEPVGRQLNLFTYLFKLALNSYIPVYEYRLDGLEVFDDSARADLKTLLDDQQIPYEQKNGRLRVDNSDIPSADVKLFYLKESVYYDHTNAQFRRKVVALCPVVVLDDEFGGMPSRRPLFWVRYADAVPYLNRQTVAASSANDAATMTFEDFFTLHCYTGAIYKTGQRTGQQVPQFGDTADNDQQQEAQRQAQQIDAEIAAFEQRVFGHTPQRDSLEAVRQQVPEATPKQRTVKGKALTGTARQPRVSVRRQRH